LRFGDKRNGHRPFEELSKDMLDGDRTWNYKNAFSDDAGHAANSLTEQQFFGSEHGNCLPGQPAIHRACAQDHKQILNSQWTDWLLPDTYSGKDGNCV